MKKTPITSPLSSGDSPAINSPAIESPAINSLSQRAHSFPFSPRQPSFSSAVPFSWEHVPGIPKNPRNPNFNSNPDHIPLPPPIRFESLKTWSDSDPFAAAFAECAKEKSQFDLEQEEFSQRRSVKRRIPAWFNVGVLGVLGLYLSCKAAADTCSVVDSTVSVRRTGTVSRRLE